MMRSTYTVSRITYLNKVTLQLQKRNKTANINVKKLWFIHELTANYTSKTAKITKKVLLLNTLVLVQMDCDNDDADETKNMLV